MKIGFYDPSNQDFAPDTPYHRPLGGTQSAICYLSAALAARGHEVSILCSTTTPGEALGVRCIAPPPGNFRVSDMNAFDVLVVATRPLARQFRRAGVTVPMVLWQHMHSGSFAEGLFGQEEQAGWTGVAFVSEYQRATFRKRWGLDGRVLRNAVSPMMLAEPLRERFFFERRDEPPTLIYASAPGRGLDFLLIAFAALREAVPDARLRVFSNMGLYNVAPKDDAYRAYYALARALPGVEFQGSVSQRALAAEFARADMLAYPTTFEETSCIVAMEAMVSGCMIAATDYGALRETCGEAADFMAYTALRNHLSANFADLAAAAIDRARREPQAEAARRREHAERARRECDWNRRAEEWEAWLGELA